MARKLRRSSGNLFRDLGFPAEEAENLRIRSELMARLSLLIEAEEWTQSEAAQLLGVSQPRVSALVRGKIDLFSIDTLVKMLSRVGLRVTVTARPRKRLA